MYQQLKQCQTFKEIANCIPEALYDKWTLCLLAYMCCIPLGAMILNHVTTRSSDLFMYLSFLLVGFASWYVTILRAVKCDFFGRGPFRYKSPVVLLLIMLALIFISSLCAKNLYYAFIGESYSHEGFLTFLSYGGVFGMSYFLNQIKYHRLLDLFLSVSTILGILTLLVYCGYQIPSFEGQMRYAAIFHNTNHYGYYLVMSALLASSLGVVKKKWYYYASFIILVATLIVNNTFGAYLGVLAGVIATILICSLCQNRLRLSQSTPLILFVMTTLFMNSMTGSVTQNFEVLESDVEKIITDAKGSEHAGSYRWAIWLAALDFIEESPLVGHGADNLGANYEEVGINMLKPHNEYLQFAATFGIPALLCYLVALLMIYLNGIKHRHILTPLTMISFCILSGYLVSAFVGNTKFYTTPYFMMFLALTLVKGEKV